MIELIFDRVPQGVHHLSIEYVASSFAFATDFSCCHRHARHQWLRAAHSIPLNIAEGNGKRSLKGPSRSLDIACGSVLTRAAIRDVLAEAEGLSDYTIG